MIKIRRMKRRKGSTQQQFIFKQGAPSALRRGWEFLHKRISAQTKSGNFCPNKRISASRVRIFSWSRAVCSPPRPVEPAAVRTVRRRSPLLRMELYIYIYIYIYSCRCCCGCLGWWGGDRRRRAFGGGASSVALLRRPLLLRRRQWRPCCWGDEAKGRPPSLFNCC